MNRMSFTAFLVVLVLVVFVALPDSGSKKAEDRVSYWRGFVEKEIPFGWEREHLLDWASENSLTFMFPDDQQTSAILESVSGWGLAGLLCPDWNVVLQVTFEPSGEGVVDRTVNKVSACH